jgi:hypothetical protein
MPILLEFQKIRNNRTKHEAYKKKKKSLFHWNFKKIETISPALETIQKHARAPRGFHLKMMVLLLNI